jgi:hypothetical protein
MNCYTVQKGGKVKEGIAVGKNADGPTVHVGERGRGRELVVVPLPEGTEVEKGRAIHIPTSTPGELVVLVHCQRGYRGSWSAEFGDGITVIAEGREAQGAAGRMGGGPEYLLRGPVGAEFIIQRRGRLYGAPSELRVEMGHPLEVVDMEAEAAAREAANKF